MGDVTGDLSARRGQITGTNTLAAGILAVGGLAPLAELNGYASRLKAFTGGHGSYTMELSPLRAGAAESAAAARRPSTRSIGGTKKSRRSQIARRAASQPLARFATEGN